jgi:pilus assembly protein Flp/PilA
MQPPEDPDTSPHAAEGLPMMNSIYRLYFSLQSMLSSEEGQDLVEYALVVALVALATTASTSALGKGLSSAFSKISSTVSSSM